MFIAQEMFGNVDILLQLLAETLPFVHEKAIETCPFPNISENSATLFSTSCLKQYIGGRVEEGQPTRLHAEIVNSVRFLWYQILMLKWPQLMCCLLLSLWALTKA
ncbi:unnamed protein product [Camellia sinensis]